MALRSYREHRTSITTGTDLKGDAPRKIAQGQLIPQIVRRSRNAVRVDGVEFYFYQRKQAGRRCSCFSIEQSADGGCLVCLGTGIVGAYDKYGCETEIGDVTRPGLRMVGLEPNYSSRTRPVMLQLMDGATEGFLEFDVDVKSNVRLVDTLQVRSNENRNYNQVRAEILCGGQWTALSEASVSRALSFTKFTIRCYLSRANASVESPLFSHVYLRYRKLEKPRVLADIPRRRRSVILQEFGISSNFQTLNLFFDDCLRNIGTEDMLIMVSEGTRWKVIEASDNRPGGQLASWDCTVRLINDYEPYMQVPT
jgi:hypothetical protein